MQVQPYSKYFSRYQADKPVRLWITVWHKIFAGANFPGFSNDSQEIFLREAHMSPRCFNFIVKMNNFDVNAKCLLPNTFRGYLEILQLLISLCLWLVKSNCNEIVHLKSVIHSLSCIPLPKQKP